MRNLEQNLTQYAAYHRDRIARLLRPRVEAGDSIL